MNTQNVKTAAPETAGRCPQTPEEILHKAKLSIIVELAKLEGSMRMHQAESWTAGEEDLEEKYCNVIAAAEFVNHLETCGGITTSHVYELVKCVEALALETERFAWSHVRQGEILSLEDYRAQAPKMREAFLVRIKESQRPFWVEVIGQAEYPEESSKISSFYTDTSIKLGHTDTINQAMDLACNAWVNDAWDAGENEWVTFSPRTVIIRDINHKTVLKGCAVELTWYEHVTDPVKLDGIERQKTALYDRVAVEMRADNHETARQLRLQAQLLDAGNVDECWRGHADVTNAIDKFIHPRYEHDEELCFANDHAE